MMRYGFKTLYLVAGILLWSLVQPAAGAQQTLNYGPGYVWQNESAKANSNFTELYNRAIARGKAWSSTETYDAGDVVTSGSSLYISLQNGNVNHAVTDGSWWGVPPGGGGATNLGTTYGSASVTITSDTGTSATIDPATTSLAGAMTSADKTLVNTIIDKLDAPVTGTTYYVNEDGTSGSGTYADPWNGSSEVTGVVPGDTIVVVGTITGGWVPAMVGTPENPITITGYHPSGVFGEISGGATSGINLNNSDYLKIENLTLSGYTTSGIVSTTGLEGITIDNVTFTGTSANSAIDLRVYNGSVNNLTITNCKFVGSGGTGVWNSTILLGNPSGFSYTGSFKNLTITNNKFLGDYEYGVEFINAGSGNFNILVNSPDGVVIDHNYFSNTRKAAIRTYSGITSRGRQSSISYNRIHSAGDGVNPSINALQLHTLRNVIVGYNYITDTQSSSGDGYGICVDTNYDDHYSIGNLVIGNRVEGSTSSGFNITGGQNTLFIGNIAANNNTGLSIGYNTFNTGNVVYHNTFYNNSYAHARIFAGGVPATTWVDNIFDTSATGIRVEDALAGEVTESHNNFFGITGNPIQVNGVAQTPDATDTATDPLLRADYRLPATSPALQAGTQINDSQGKLDRWGNINSYLSNIGAYFGDGE